MEIRTKQTNIKPIEKQVIDIINSKFNIDKKLLSNNDECLLGSKIRMKPRELFYLFFEVEQAFKIQISEKSILEQKFISVNTIVDTIESSLS